ncbi:MAG: hypothetical protein AB7Q42_09665 [Acidimicrobiia bacterium]
MGDGLESFGQLVVLLPAVVVLDLLGLKTVDLSGEPAIFLGERLGRDLVVVVQIEELASLPSQRRQ